MQITAKTDKKKQVFKPITITLSIIIETEAELQDFKDLEKAYNKGTLDNNFDGESYYEFPSEIAYSIAKQL